VSKRSGGSVVAIETALLALEHQLVHAGYALDRSTDVGPHVLVGRRSTFRWSTASRRHTFVVVFETPARAEERAKQWTCDARDRAARLAPRSRTATVAVFVCQATDPRTRSWFRERQMQDCCPVLVDLALGTLTYRQDPGRGGSISRHLHDVVRQVIAPAFPLTGARQAEVAEIAGYAAYREQIEHEDHLLGVRVGWLIASEAFLFAAYANAKGVLRPPELTRLIELLPWIGIAIAALVFLAICAAIRALHHLWNRGPSLPGFPPVVGNWSTHLLGLAPPVLIPIGLALAWLRVGFGVG